jgi:hypothetical protein
MFIIESSETTSAPAAASREVEGFGVLLLWGPIFKGVIGAL